MTENPGPINYWDYIRVPDLLSLQSGLDDDDAKTSDDEVLFIVTHQVYELWFKVAIRDLVAARDLFRQDHVRDDALAGACRRFERLHVIFQLAQQHFPLIETLTTRDYLEFRDKLFPANGGQSSQFREIELLLGLEDAVRIPYVGGESYEDVLRGSKGEESWALGRLRARKRDGVSLKVAIDHWLYRTPIHGSFPDQDGDDDAVLRFIDGFLAAHKKSMEDLAGYAVRNVPESEARVLRERYMAGTTQAREFLLAEDVEAVSERKRRRRIRAATLFIEVYRELPLLAWPREVLDKIVALEQGFVAYRQRHARMAERVIGRRVGTGGSSGVEYLDAVALRYRIFHDLWAVRTLLVQRGRLPDPERPEFYGFRSVT